MLLSGTGMSFMASMLFGTPTAGINVGEGPLELSMSTARLETRYPPGVKVRSSQGSAVKTSNRFGEETPTARSPWGTGQIRSG